MAAQVTHIKIREPRKLECQETRISLQQWKMQFRQYIKQDDHYRGFIASDVVWNPLEDNYGFITETTGLQRNPRALKDDCQDFLHTLATFLPHGYLTEKLVSTATSFIKAFEIIEEHYGLLPSQESFLDLDSFTKQPNESYRQFYERIVAHARQHLHVTAGINVDGAIVPNGGDRISVSHSNLLALIWLRKVHPELVNIVRTEYSLELRENKPLASLVPRIAVNVDNLLSKYDKISGVNAVMTNDDDSSSYNTINRTFIKKNLNKNKDVKAPFCPGCYSLFKNSKIQLHFKHSSSECPRKAVIQMLQMQDVGVDVNQLDLDNSGSNEHLIQFSNFDSQQVKKQNDYNPPTSLCFNVNTLSNNGNMDTIIASIKSSINSFRKEASPTLCCSINSQNVVCIVDEGSVINCCSMAFVKRAKIPVESVNCAAVGANKSPMSVIGITKYDVYATVIGTSNPCKIVISRLIVIKDLGADVLLGQPTKVDNCVITIPHKSQIQFKCTEGKEYKVSYPIRDHDFIKLHDVLKITDATTLYPGDQYSYKLPNHFIMQKKVMITERPNITPWIGGQIVDVHDGCVKLTNETIYPIHLKKHQHIADVYNVNQIGQDDAMTTGADIPTFEHLEPYEDWDFNEDFVSDVQIDPDDTMNQHWKNKFLELCKEYTDIINYRPARYNGYYGDVNNSIDFATLPPPTQKVYMPKYSDTMNDILASKMDQLEKWKVLVKPEDIDVVPKFVCPSLLVPKHDSDDWRLITNFTPLNKFIRKPPSSTPTIEETKVQISKFRHLVTLDLANYYYQHGVKKCDMQYLATNHPFKGLRIYTCEPQGLKGVSEHTYERLSRVYGELCQQHKMARQADGLFVGGDSFQDLYDNLKEVFQRTRNSGLTLKPSKIIINPQKITLFGWIREKGAWRPTEHTTSPLAKASPPKTVKQLRSFLGAIKQISPCIKDYAVKLSPLERIVAGKGSPETITWTDMLTQQFEDVKRSLNDIQEFHIPIPSDTLHTFSDWSQANGAIGGRLEIHRTNNDGTIDKLHGGFFSARVSEWQARWLPCEGEALASKAVIHHFRPLLQNATRTVIHHTDSLPTCQAWEKSKTGAFSNSARISAFLTEISSLNIEFKHTPGSKLEYSDYASRHAITCPENSCQVCKYLKDLVFTADNVVGAVKVEDIERGNICMPFTQQSAWRQAQSQDRTLQTLVELIKTGQTPEKRKTCNDFTTLKLLYNLHCKGSLKISSQGLITVTNNQETGDQTQAIVVPQALYPGLAHSIHLKTMHSSKQQLQRLMCRYFYAVGHQRMVAEVIDNCHTCLSLKQLPKELFPETTGEVKGFGSHFACDVMVRHSQKILLIREKLTQYTHGCILANETGQDIMTAIIKLIVDKVPDYGTTIRTDNASTFQKVSSMSNVPGSWLEKFNIRIEMGDTFNHNRNPIAENLVKECHKEINKAGFADSPLDECQLAVVIRNINSRIRNRGLSAKEMCFMRDQATNRNIAHNDDQLQASQKEKRIQSHNKVPPVKVTYDTGDTVMIKDQLSKTKPREKFIVVDPDISETHVKVQKQDKNFFTRQYNVAKHQLVKMPRKAKIRARKKLAETSHLYHLKPLQCQIPLHAFDSASDSDDQDSTYQTITSPQDTDQNLSSSPSYSTLNEGSNVYFDDTDSHFLSPTDTESNSTLSSYPTAHYPFQPMSRFNSLDDLVQSNREFLKLHPKPPTIPPREAPLRRSTRVKQRPARYDE